MGEPQARRKGSSRRSILRGMGGFGVLSLLAAGSAGSGQVHATVPTLRVGVAANMSGTAHRLARAFEQTLSVRIEIAVGSTGKLHAHILHGAPYDVLLAADERTPMQLERSGHAVVGTRFTYAVGRLALWSADPEVVDDQARVLQNLNGQRLARANPNVSPYGLATVQTMQALGLHVPRVQWVEAESIAQAHQFVASGGVRCGFVAWSQIQRQGRLMSGSAWRVPESLHQRIRQDAVLLALGAHSAAARAFLSFMRSAPAQEILRDAGYEIA